MEKKKKWTKETFIEACNEQMKNVRDPKFCAARRCVKGKKAYDTRARRAKTAAHKKVKNAKS